LLKYRIDELLDLTLDNERYIYFKTKEKNIVSIIKRENSEFENL